LAYRHTEPPWYANAFSLLIEHSRKKNGARGYVRVPFSTTLATPIFL